MNTDVLILGSGPAAAYAVLACEKAGVNFRVVSNRPPRVEQAGAFFLHWLPPTIKAEAEKVPVFGNGTREGYLTKQWGPAYVHIPTSFPEERREEWWYSSLALNQVWEHTPVQLVAGLNDNTLRALAGAESWVFHTFTSQRAASRRKLVQFPTLTHDSGIREGYGFNRVIYNGDLAEDHARTTVAWGRMSIEFPSGMGLVALRDYHRAFHSTPDLVYLRDIPPETPPVEKDEWLGPNIMPIGRFATWDRRALSHHTYNRVLEVLNGHA